MIDTNERILVTISLGMWNKFLCSMIGLKVC